MRRRIATLLLAALALGGCSGSEQGASETASPAPAVPPRSIALVWGDILGQRDQIYAAVSKGTDMWHEECAQVSAAAAALDQLAIQLGASIAAAIPAGDVRRNNLELRLGYLFSTTSGMRAAAIEEQVGSLPSMMIGLDALLQAMETFLTPQELGNQSVVTRPGFNPVRPAPMPSPV